MDAETFSFKTHWGRLLCRSFFLTLLSTAWLLQSCSSSQGGAKTLLEEEPLAQDESSGAEASPAATAVGSTPKPTSKPQPKKKATFHSGFNVGSYLFVHTARAHVRSGAGLECRVVKVLKNKAKVRVLGRQGKWVRIGDKLWISQKTLTPLQAPYLLTQTAYIYSAPSSDAEIVAKFKKGKAVQVQGVYNAWAKIGPRHYVLRRNLALQQP